MLSVETILLQYAPEVEATVSCAIELGELMRAGIRPVTGVWQDYPSVFFFAGSTLVKTWREERHDGSIAGHVMLTEEAARLLRLVEVHRHDDEPVSELGIDTETYSDVSIKDCGAHRYIEDDSFEILLFAYSVNGGPVAIVDMARGEKIPQRILDALVDPDCLKTAWNAAFERNALGKMLGRRLDPHQWECTMVTAAASGYPLSLDEAGKALGLPEDSRKMKEGKELIRFFCVPRKVRPGASGPAARKRNMPQNDFEKWETFKAYCVRDVETEQHIRGLLRDRRLSCGERELYAIDQDINDRGVLCNLRLAANASRMYREHCDALLQEAKELSGLENPNSVSQLKGLLGVTSLNKKVLPDIKAKADDAMRRVLEIREATGKTPIRKYDTMLAAACRDGRVRGCLQFDGARTGRWCLSGDHEVLTPEGWRRLDEWNGGSIMCWNPSNEFLSFSRATPNNFDYVGEMYHINSQRCDQLCTPEHRMPYYTEEGWKCDKMKNLNKRFKLPINGIFQRLGTLDDNKIRILIMTQADGYYTEDGILRFHFKKLRKIERCKRLLRREGIVFGVSTYEDRTAIVIKRKDVPLFLRMFADKTFGPWLLNEDPCVVFDEIQEWDGYRCGPNSVQYMTTNKTNADLLQALAVTSGRHATLVIKHRDKKEWNDVYVLNIWLNPGKTHEVRKEHISTTTYVGKVFCPTTSTGFFVVRRNGKVWITGNSGRVLQIQNLPQNHIAEIDFARQLVLDGDAESLEMVYGDIPSTLSQLIRTALVAPEGQQLIVCDYSAIEARVIAWLAGEEWRLDLFRRGGDIYCESASRIYKVPVSKHGPNAHLRQKGKIMELALGYGGGVGSMVSFGAGKVMADDEMKEAVSMWRDDSPAIVKLWYDLEKMFFKSLSDGRRHATHGVVVGKDGDDMYMELPSGRRAYYPGMHIAENRFGRNALAFWGVDQETHKWTTLETYGGKLTENLCQAVARDCLAGRITALEHDGYRIVMHIHDEVVIEAREGQTLEQVEKYFAHVPGWAKGLPLKGAGYVTPYYLKD